MFVCALSLSLSLIHWQQWSVLVLVSTLLLVNVCVHALFGVALLRAPTCIGIGALLFAGTLSRTLLDLLSLCSSLYTCTCLHSGGALCFVLFWFATRSLPSALRSSCCQLLIGRSSSSSSSRVWMSARTCPLPPFLAQVCSTANASCIWLGGCGAAWNLVRIYENLESPAQVPELWVNAISFFLRFSRIHCILFGSVRFHSFSPCPTSVLRPYSVFSRSLSRVFCCPCEKYLYNALLSSSTWQQSWMPMQFLHCCCCYCCCAPRQQHCCWLCW